MYRHRGFQDGGGVQTNYSVGSKQRKAFFNSRAHRCTGLISAVVASDILCNTADFLS